MNALRLYYSPHKLLINDTRNTCITATSWHSGIHAIKENATLYMVPIISLRVQFQGFISLRSCN